MSDQPKPQEQPKPAPQPKPQAVEENIKARLNELVNVNRIVTNGINLVMDVSIKGGHAGPVAEFLNWLSGFSQSLTTQIKTLEATLPKKPEPKKIEPKLVSHDAQEPKPSEPVAKPVNVSTKA